MCTVVQINAQFKTMNGMNERINCFLIMCSCIKHENGIKLLLRLIKLLIISTKEQHNNANSIGIEF